MNDSTMGLTGLGFWLAVALVVVAIIWAVVRKQQMKHELTLKLLEKGQGVDPEMLTRLLATAPAPPGVQKSVTEQHRDAGGMTGFIFIISGLIILVVGMARHSGLSWPLVVLGAITCLYGHWTWHQTIKEYYLRKKAEGNSSGD